MAHEDDWRSNRGRTGSFWNPDRPQQRWRGARFERGYGDYPGDRDEPPGAGFERRGWRPGSDYYGNDPGRYGSGYGSETYEFGGGQRGVWENQDIDYSGRDTGRSSFNDRWQDAYRGQGRGPSQGPFRGRGPKGYKRSDERIREDVCERLTQDDRVDASNVEVTVKNCEVTLTGTVGSREEKRRAEDISDNISGVTDVSNKLRVSEERAQETGEQGRQSAATQPTPGSRH